MDIYEKKIIVGILNIKKVSKILLIPTHALSKL